MIEPRKLLILVGSPRRAGNSATLAKAVQRGAEATGRKIMGSAPAGDSSGRLSCHGVTRFKEQQ